MEISAHNTTSSKAKMRQNSDQRYFPRWQLESKVTYQLENDPQPHTGITSNLSCTGACLCTDNNILPRQKIQMALYLSESKILNLNGHVVWVKGARAESGKNQIGIGFINMSPLMQEMILQHIFKFRGEELTKHWFKGWKEKSSKDKKSSPPLNKE